MAVKDNTGTEIGIIGLQFDIQEYIKLIPSPVIEEPYSLSFINLYDKNLNTIWHWGCDDCLQDYTTAEAIIRREFKDAGDQFVQWKEPKQVNLIPIAE